MPLPPERWMPSLKAQASVGTLIYFPFRARGEPPHMVAAYTGNLLENAVLPFSEYGWMRRTSPNGLCPWIVLPDGRQIAETLDICIHLAGLSSPAGRALAPFDDTQRKLFEISNEPPLMHSRDNPENCAWLLNMLPWAEAEHAVPHYMARALPILREVEALPAAASGPLFGGSTPGVGDIGLFSTVDMILSIAPDALSAPSHELPRLRAWYSAMAALPGIDEYLVSRPQRCGNPGSLMFTGRA